MPTRFDILFGHEPGMGCSFMGEAGRIVASNERIGHAHEMAQRAMQARRS